MTYDYPRRGRFDELLAGRDVARGLKGVRAASDALLDALRRAKAEASVRLRQKPVDDDRVAALTAELTELRKRLAEKEAYAARRLTELVTGFVSALDAATLRFRAAIIDVRLRYDKIAADGAMPAEVSELRRAIASLRAAIETALSDELRPLADNVSLALENASAGAVKKLSALVRELDKTAAPDLIPNDVAVKKAISESLRRLDRDVRSLDRLYDATYGLGAALAQAADEAEAEAEAEVRPEPAAPEPGFGPEPAPAPDPAAGYRLPRLDAEPAEPEIPDFDPEPEREAAPDFISPPGADAALLRQTEMAEEISRLKAALREELKAFKEIGAERESRWKIFMENEQARHASQIAQIRAEFSAAPRSAPKDDGAAEFAAKLAQKQDELRATVDAARAQLQALAERRAEPVLVPEWGKEDDAAVAAKGEEIERLLQALRAARSERDSLEANKQHAYAAGIGRNDLAAELEELADINGGRAKAAEEERRAADAAAAKAQALAEEYAARRAELEAALRAAAGRVDQQVVTEAVTDRVAARFQQEIDRLREENANLLQYMQQLQPAPDPLLAYDPFAGAWAPPPGFGPEQFGPAPEAPSAEGQPQPAAPEPQPAAPETPSGPELGPDPEPEPLPETASAGDTIVQGGPTINVQIVKKIRPVRVETSDGPAFSDPNLITRRARFVPTGEERDGRLSSEQIRRYANALIAANRPRPKAKPAKGEEKA